MASSRAIFLLLAFFVSLLNVQINGNPRPQGLFSRVGESSRANYTVSFVPLISVIANFFPRLLNRFAPQTQHARSQQTASTPGVMEATCNEVYPYRLQWPDPKNRQQYFYCYQDPACLLLLRKSGINETASEFRCYSLQTEKCPPYTVFDFHKQQCISK